MVTSSKEIAESQAYYRQVSTDQINLDLVAGQTLSTTSQSRCAMECVNSDCECLGFLYDIRDKSCVLMSCVNLELTPNNSRDSEIYFYVEDRLNISHLLARGYHIYHIYL